MGRGHGAVHLIAPGLGASVIAYIWFGNFLGGSLPAILFSGYPPYRLMHVRSLYPHLTERQGVH